MTSAADDRRWMALALALGGRGLGQVWPNPAVGCVLIKDGAVIGRGWTQPGGRPHAETVALAQAGRRAKGACAYVTLEPCAHHGKTPPCADALIAAGVTRVVIGITDPDPRVAGQGIARLQDAGVTVEDGVLAAEAQDSHTGFLTRITQGRPMVTLKLATSLDGRIATGAGKSQWITGPEARHHVHGLRLRHDAVLVGAGTARADDPSLTVRGFGAVPQPVRIVAGARLDLPQQGQLAKTASDIPVWLLHGPDAAEARKGFWAEAGADLLEVPKTSGGPLDMVAALQALGARGLTRVLCEGGGQLAASLLQAGLVDRIVHYHAGLAIGAEGYPAIGALGLSELDEAQRFELVSVRAIGGDCVSTYRKRD